MKPRRIVWTLMAAIAVAIMSTLTVAISDLYLSGHGIRGLTQAIIVSEFGVALSVGDVIMMSATTLAAALAWWTYDKN